MRLKINFTNETFKLYLCFDKLQNQVQAGIKLKLSDKNSPYYHLQYFYPSVIAQL